MDTALASRMPRLELCLALAAAGLGIMIASISAPLRLLPLTWEPPVIAVVGGWLMGTLLRLQSRARGQWPDEGRAERKFFATFVFVGAVAGMGVSHLVTMTLPQFIAPPLWEGAILGAIAATALLPAARWLLRQARRCVRARLGSLVSAADRRAIWGVTAVALALFSWLGLVRWMSRWPTTSPLAPVVVAGLAALIAIVVLIADRRARRTVVDLDQRSETMESIPARNGDVLEAKTDLGVGEPVLGHRRPGASYREGTTTVPLVRGCLVEARAMLDAVCLRSIRRAGFACATLAVHLIAVVTLG